MKLLVGGSLFVALAMSSTSAFAFIGDCSPGGTGVTVAPDNRSASIIPDFFGAFGGDTNACKQDVAVPIPAGSYGVYKVDVRGFTAQNDGETSTYTVTVNGTVQEKVLAGEYLDDVAYTKYFETGTGGAASFDSRYDLSVTGDPGSSSEINSIDVLAGYTTMGSIKASLTDIGKGETALVTHLGATAGLLTGSNQKLEGDNEIGVIGGFGSYLMGVNARYNLSDGFSVLGGLSLVDQAVGGASASGPLGAVAVRYVDPGYSSFRLFGEGGASLAGLSATFSRHYEDGSPEGVTAKSSTTAYLGNIYVRGGVVISPDENNEIALSASLGESAFGLGGFSETLGAANLFPASFGDQTGYFTTLKGTAAWTTQLTQDVDLTATASIGTVVAHTPIKADVAFVGPASGPTPGAVFAEYGVRLGWTVSPTARLDGFVQGSAGTNGIGNHTMVGAAAHMKF